MPDATLIAGDCRDAMRRMAEDGQRFHACITDPPYELSFMARKWDGTGIAFDPVTWRAVYDVLLPGAHLLAFGGTRTYHRMACAIEDAGFEIRDCVMWMYGTGFPKSHDVSKGIDKHLGAAGSRGERKPDPRWQGRNDAALSGGRVAMRDTLGPVCADSNAGFEYVAASTEAAAWAGWGTALKPAYEPVIVARRPLDGTVAANVLAHGCGGLNIDGCRIPGAFVSGWSKSGSKASENVAMSGANYAREAAPDSASGRWPANVIHDGSDEVLAAFAAYGERTSGSRKAGVYGIGGSDTVYGARGDGEMPALAGDSGTAARFFKSCPFDDGEGSRFHYSAKATAADRAGSKHPTVKPQALMRYLCKLVTPPGGHILEPFAGSGSTLQAALAEGFNVTGIEKEPEYQADILTRLEKVQPALAIG